MESRTTNPAWFIKPKNYSELHYSISSSLESLGKPKLYLKYFFFNLLKPSINDITHFLRLLVPPSTLSPILLGKYADRVTLPFHSSEKRGLRSTFLSGKMLQNLPYL